MNPLQAGLDGGMAALARKPESANPHAPRTPEHAKWLRSYREIAGAK